MTINRPILFQYVVLWHPTEKQIKDNGDKTKLVLPLTAILAVDATAAQIQAAMNIPEVYKTQLDQLQIALRPF